MSDNFLDNVDIPLPVEIIELSAQPLPVKASLISGQIVKEVPCGTVLKHLYRFRISSCPYSSPLKEDERGVLLASKLYPFGG